MQLEAKLSLPEVTRKAPAVDLMMTDRDLILSKMCCTTQREHSLDVSYIKKSSLIQSLTY